MLSAAKLSTAQLSAAKMLTAMPLFVAVLSQAQVVATPPGVAVLFESVPQPEPSIVRLEDTDNLHVLIKKGFRVKGVGQSLTGEVTQPVFHGEQQVIPAGSTIQGHVAGLHGAGVRAYVVRLSDGDLTPPRIATVAFDELVLKDGQHIQLETNRVEGIDGLKMSLWEPKGERQSLKAQAKMQIHDAIAAPNKLQRFSEAMVISLPYHPQYIDQGTVFNVSPGRPSPVAVSTPALPSGEPKLISGKPQYLHLRLLTALNSGTSVRQQSVVAVVSEPYYTAQHQLLVTAGTQLTGQVHQVRAAAWLHRQGALRFDFSPAQVTQGVQRVEHPYIAGVEAQKDQFLAVDKEGGLRATAPRLRQITAPLAFIGPSTALTDYSKVKTGYQRAGEGRKSFGLLGSGAAQASASTAIGFGYYAAAKRVYSAFIAKGSDVDLPANTALLVRIDADSMQ